MEKFFFIIVGYLVNAGLLYAFSKCIKDFNLLKWLCMHLPGLIGGIISFILLALGGAISCCMIFQFGGLAYEAFNDSNILLLVQYVILDACCMFYLGIMLNKL